MEGIGDGEGEWKWICSWFFLLSMKLYSSVDLFYAAAIEDLIFLFFHSATFFKNTIILFFYKKKQHTYNHIICLLKKP